MSFKAYPVPPFTTGLEKDADAFLIPEDAQPYIENAYIWRKKIVRKEGTDFIGIMVERAFIRYLNVLFVGNDTYTNAMPPNQSIPTTVLIQIIDTGGPGIIYTFVDNGSGVLTDVGTGPGTVSYAAGGAFVINFPALPAPAGQYDVYVSAEYFPYRPVMALPTRETIVLNDEELLAFDVDKVNRYNIATETFQDISFSNGVSSGYAGAPVNAWPANGQPIIWSGTDWQFFWCCNTDIGGTRLFWAVNHVAADGIRYYDGTPGVPNLSGGWSRMCPLLTTGAPGTRRYFLSCRILITYKDRLLAFNTQEYSEVTALVTNFQNRCRFSQLFENAAPTAATAWDEITIGRGGYIDAPTPEQIVSVEFYKDVLLVFFERSTWQLVYTNNEVQPFYWQQINNQYGCESTNSVVPFDKGVFAVGDKAIITSDTINVERIDLKIPDEVFDIHNDNQGPYRVYGIRDYQNMFVYWIVPSASLNKIYPDRVLCMNYLEGAYSYFKESWTCFGYFQRVTDYTWADMVQKWETYKVPWNSFRNQSRYPAICVGNQQGFINFFDGLTYNNAISLHITGITQDVNAQVTSNSHNLQVGQYVQFEQVLGMIQINNLIGMVTAIRTANVFDVDINSTGFAAYTGGGYLRIIDGFDIWTKKYNPFYNDNKQVRVNYFDSYLSATTDAYVNLDVYVDDNTSTPIIEGLLIPTFDEYGPTVPDSKFWKRAYIDAKGQYLQFRFYLGDDLMRDPDTNVSAFILHAMTLWLMPVGRLFSY